MNADRLARCYRWIEYAAFGPALNRSRDAFVHRLAERRHVLVLGEGDGRALKQMLAAAPRARFDVIEASMEMIALARDRIGASDRVSFYCQDALSGFLPGTNYDAVVTFFFLDCFTESALKELLMLIAPQLIPGTIWLVSEFAIPAKGWRRLHARAWIWLMYRFFRVTTGLRTRALPPIGCLLSEHGLHRTDIHQRRWSMIASEVFVYQESRPAT